MLRWAESEKIMVYKVFTEHPDELWTRKWNDFLADALFPTHYTTPNFFVDPFVRGGRRFAVLALENEKITGVLTGVDSGKSIVSGLFVRPQICLSKMANRRETAGAFLEGMREKGGDDLEVIELFSWHPVTEFEEFGFQAREYGGEQGTIMLDLTRGADELFKDFSQTRRNELRKAIRQDQVQISEVETKEELAELYQIHCDWNRRKGNQPDKFEDFEIAWQQKDYRKIFIAKHEGKVIAGSYYRFCPGGVVEYAANNSIPEYQKLRPNDLLGWHSIQWACREGFPLYSMGGSHLFLRRFGGEAVSTYRYKLDLTLLKVHQLKETVNDFGIKTYKRLPEPVRTKIKAVLGKD